MDTPEPKEAHPVKTLIVEDDASIRILLQRILEKYGECHFAENGAQAVEVFADARAFGNPFDLVCLDIMMPEMDGHEALRRMRTIEEQHGIMALNGATIIMITALNDYRAVSDAYSGLCTEYLVKPFEKARLLELLIEHRLITPEQAAVR